MPSFAVSTNEWIASAANSYAAERETLAECETHRVSLWTTEDLIRVLTIGVDAFEMRPLFAPGLAANALTDLEWSRAHGSRKRVAVICDALREAGWAAQVVAADYRAPADAPLLTEGAAIMLVDQLLAAHGLAHRMHARRDPGRLSLPHVPARPRSDVDGRRPRRNRHSIATVTKGLTDARAQRVRCHRRT